MTTDIDQLLSAESRALLDTLYDGVYVVDRDRRIRYWNRGAELITGFKRREVCGRKCQDDILCHIDETGALLCAKGCPLLDTLNTGRVIEAKVYPRTKAGHRVPVSTHISPIRDEAKRIIGAIEVFRDVSAEERLNALERKFHKLIKRYVSSATYKTVLVAAEKDQQETASIKDLTVMFVDIVGFTAISERYSPVKILQILNTFFTITSQLIVKNSGDIDKFIGDCVMAIFNDAQSAVKTAEALLENGVPQLNQSLKERGLPAIEVRIGINSGPLIQGEIGSADRKDMTVIGDVVNTASRVEKITPPGSFMISESTLTRLSDPQRFEFVEQATLKGKSIPIKVFGIKS